MKNFFSVMLNCKRIIFENRDRLAADVYKKVQVFVESGVYSKCKKADDIASMTLNGYNAYVIAEKYNLSYETIRVEKRQISEELWRIFPVDFFSKLCEYRENKEYIDDCLYSISHLNVKSSNLVFFDVVKEIKDKPCKNSSIEYDYTELRNEIDFLMRYSREFFKFDLANVDIDKLKYLIDVIDGNTGNVFIRSNILKEFEK